MAARSWLVVGALAAISFGCGGGNDEPSAPPASSAASSAATTAPSASAPVGSAAADEAKQIFATRCFTCHGPQGLGDGPGSAALTPKPRNFSDAAWQASVNDDHIAKIIQYGGAAVGKSPSMPSNPDLMSKPEVVAALVAHVRSLAAPK